MRQLEKEMNATLFVSVMISVLTERVDCRLVTASLVLFISLCFTMSCGRAAALEMANATPPDKSRSFAETTFPASYLKFGFPAGAAGASEGTAAGAETGTVVTTINSMPAEAVVFCRWAGGTSTVVEDVRDLD